MSSKNLQSLFEDTLKDIYFAEKAIVKALPKMMKASQSEELEQAFQTHLEQTKDHVTRLERVFELIGKKASAKTCEAIKGIITEGDEIASEYRGSEAIDAGLLATAQAVEHYEIARYGTLRNWARDLGVDEAAELLAQTLGEEKETDKLLTKLADAGINESAQAQS